MVLCHPFSSLTDSQTILNPCLPPRGLLHTLVHARSPMHPGPGTRTLRSVQKWLMLRWLWPFQFMFVVYWSNITKKKFIWRCDSEAKHVAAKAKIQNRVVGWLRQALCQAESWRLPRNATEACIKRRGVSCSFHDLWLYFFCFLISLSWSVIVNLQKKTIDKLVLRSLHTWSTCIARFRRLGVSGEFETNLSWGLTI